MSPKSSVTPRKVYMLSLSNAIKACRVARTLLESEELDYEDIIERLEGCEVELSDIEGELKPS